MKNKKGFSSICTHDDMDSRAIRPQNLPIYPTSSFRFNNIEQGIDAFLGKADEHLYSRYTNPTMDTVAAKIARLEGYGLDITPKCYLTSSGMSAISTVLIALLKQGDKILTQGNLYGGTTVLMRDVLADYGVEMVIADFKKPHEVEEYLKKDKAIQLMYLETPANPTMACIDLECYGKMGQQYGIYTMVDNTFCTPYLQQPLKYGLDFVVHSTTKFINGHGNSVAGAIIGKDPELMKNTIFRKLKLLGTNCNAFDAWMINNGMKTLELRMKAHSKNALAVAHFLEKHHAVKVVNYNGLASHPDHELAKKQMRDFGGMLSFELKGGFDAAVKMMNRLQFCSLAPTLGDVDTLLMHPASMSHVAIPKAIREANGIMDGLVRISVGIENIEDILEDLEQAMKD